MKKTILSSLLILTSSTLLANTTMCFKENHSSMSTIENVKLDGGECKSSYSVNEMKSKGWEVDDIKITTTSNGMNFIYIFKTPNSSTNTTSFSNTNESQEQMEARILAKLEKKKEEEKKAKELEEKISLESDGEKLYISQCQSCHGSKGEVEAKGFSRPLNTLSLDEMKITIRDYIQGNYDRGLAVLMKPIANSISTKDIEKVHAYLNKLNK